MGDGWTLYVIPELQGKDGFLGEPSEPSSIPLIFICC